jgi:transcriptional regulator with XRE-family HTH domain
VEEIGISQSMLSMIENGRANIGPRVRLKIEKWLHQCQA